MSEGHDEFSGILEAHDENEVLKNWPDKGQLLKLHGRVGLHEDAYVH